MAQLLSFILKRIPTQMRKTNKFTPICRKHSYQNQNRSQMWNSSHPQYELVRPQYKNRECRLPNQCCSQNWKNSHHKCEDDRPKCDNTDIQFREVHSCGKVHIPGVKWSDSSMKKQIIVAKKFTPPVWRCQTQPLPIHVCSQSWKNSHH